MILVPAITCFMRRELTRVNGYFEVTIPEHLSGEFESHFRMPWETCQLLTQEIMHTGTLSERPAILPAVPLERGEQGTISYDRHIAFQMSTSVYAR